LTAFGDVASAVEAMKLGAFDYLEKPISSPAALRELCARALARRRQLVSPVRDFSATDQKALASQAPAMRPVVDAIAKVAKTNATVLLSGESGTGKEVTARAIHDLGPRASGPFVAINCAVLTENLLESELFGHEKGAFTGAHTQRRGRLELADGGTFFLDEVGELEPGLQAKLLRALEERQFERLGGARPVTIDVRWIAATHRDLRKMVAAGTFRDDLYHRLAVFPIKLPALRERREDIVALAHHLLRALSGATPAPFSPAVERALLARPWPGNVRELKNALERALILADGGPLTPELFASDDASERDAESAPPSLSASSLEELEKQAIARALAAAGGNRKAAAERLGIGLRTLYEKLKRYGIR
ncbi:MAG: sigma-54-dependent Fis family transcriptional regulator, partial [Myxococcales bacterium]|nr:sigma-54-dependent Fis family transcriptional regulator [Myxococcales bacterium]